MNVDHGVVDIQVFVRDACANTAGARTRTARNRRGMSAAWKRTDQRTWVTGEAERRSAERGSGSRQEGQGNFLHGFVSCGGLERSGVCQWRHGRSRPLGRSPETKKAPIGGLRNSLGGCSPLSNGAGFS